MYAITGASGQLGRLVLESLLGKVAPDQIVALVRNPDSVADFAARGVQVRHFDYNKPDTLVPALAGVDRLLLISSSEVGQREAQHRAVIDAAQAAGVGFVAYTSILHGPASPMILAEEHKATEAALAESGLAHALLRNGWYTENYLMAAGAAIEHGALLGSAGDGRVSAATRADYAEAAAVVLSGDDRSIRAYDLAGDTAFTMPELATVLSEVAGKPIPYQNLSQDDYANVLVGAGLPAPLAAILADSDARTADGALFDNGKTLSALIGRPTTPWRDTILAALKG